MNGRDSMLDKLSVLDLVALLFVLAVTVFAIALGTSIPGAVMGGFLAGACIKAWFWLIAKLDKR